MDGTVTANTILRVDMKVITVKAYSILFTSLELSLCRRYNQYILSLTDRAKKG